MLNPSFVARCLVPGQETIFCSTLTVKPTKLDIMFSYDTTGSMSGIIESAKTQTALLINKLTTLGIDIAYGVISYMDYPHSYDSYGYSATYGVDPDYAYKLDQAITSDIPTVLSKINSLTTGYGADSPQDYTRIFYESYSDPNIAWREDSVRLLINFADNVPHDNNLNEGVPGKTDVWSTGGDPGRDEIMFTSDDLDLQTVLAEMKTNNVILLEAQSEGAYLEYWEYWTGITGGQAFVLQAADFVDDVYNAIEQQILGVEDLQLVVDPPAYTNWLISVDPTSISGLLLDPVTFKIRIQVPAGTPEGLYKFRIIALEKGKPIAENLGIINVEINVILNKSGGSLVEECITPICHQCLDSCQETCTYCAKWVSGYLKENIPLAQGYYSTLINITKLSQTPQIIRCAFSIPAQQGLPACRTEWQEKVLHGYETYQITEAMITQLLDGTPYANLAFIDAMLIIVGEEKCLQIKKLTTFYQVNWITNCCCTNC